MEMMMAAHATLPAWNERLKDDPAGADVASVNKSDVGSVSIFTRPRLAISRRIEFVLFRPCYEQRQQ